jgi:hypothetical protein
MLKRLCTHNIIKSVGGTYKYYITELSRTVDSAEPSSSWSLPRVAAMTSP